MRGKITLLALLLCAPAAAETRGPGEHRFTLEHQGRARVYRVWVPASYDGKKAVPAVLLLHGGGGDLETMVRSTRMDALAEREGFLAVYPEGIGKRRFGQNFGTWNAGACCGEAKRLGIDDVGFLSKLIDRLREDFRVDADRVYAAGHSNGAIMCYRLACELAGKLAAIAPYGSTGEAVDCKPARALSILHAHGVEDSCADYKGGSCGGCWSRILGMKADEQRPCESAADHSARWRRILGCSGKPREWKEGPASCAAYACRGGAEVALCSVEGLGHAWPGDSVEAVPVCKRRPRGKLCRRFTAELGPYRPDFALSERIWKFFKDKRRAAVP